jgi:hypothetical protein
MALYILLELAQLNFCANVGKDIQPKKRLLIKVA